MSKNLLSVDLKCNKTGAYLGVFNCTIIEGSTMLLQNLSEATMLHPFFGLSDHVLLNKFDDAINTLINDSWEPSNRANINKLQILTVAIVDRLGCFVSRHPTLPSEVITIGSCIGLRSVARWFLTETSRRPMFPGYCPAGNAIHWESFRAWLWSCFEIREEYQNKIRRIHLEAEQKAREDAAREVVNSSVGYKKSDLKKIWNWLEIQLESHINSGRMQTFKRIFLLSDIEPELWEIDDVEDLQIEIAAYCDSTSNVYTFALHRCRALADYLDDFYGSFKLISDSNIAGNSILEQQRNEELAAELDAKLAASIDLVPPVETDYTSRALFIKAQAEYRLLLNRAKLRKQS